VPVAGSEFTLDVDAVIPAIGQQCELDAFTAIDGVSLSRRQTITADELTFAANDCGVFAGGDAATGPKSVIQAVVSARRAAANIHAFVMDVPKEPAESRFNFTRGRSFDDVALKNFDNVEIKLREKMPERPPEVCIQDFDEVKLGFTEKMARRESERCLSCGCTAFDRCDLKRLDIAFNVNINKTGMGKVPLYPIDETHRAIRVDRNKCIYCTRCVRSCAYDALELKAESFDDKGRPVRLEIIFHDNCVSCGNCVDNCSTGALNKKNRIVPVQSEKVETVRTTCPYCGTGCQIDLRIKGKTVLEASADPDSAPNYGDLCVKGRFGHAFIQHPDRLKTPLIRRQKGGVLEPATWEQALDFMAGHFARILGEHGADALAGLSSARCTVEENYAFQKFFRSTLGTNNVDHCARY